MNKMVKEIHVARHKWQKWRKLLKIADMERQKGRAKGLGAQPDDSITLASVTFDDGTDMVLSLVSGQTNYYVDTEMITADGQLICDAAEPVFELTPEMVATHDGTKYIIRFVIHDDEKKVTA